MKEITLDTSYTMEFTVADFMSAKQVGSGDADVLATPIMIAWMENAAKHALQPFLEAGETTVGIHVDCSHDAASPIGINVKVTAVVKEVHRRIITFDVYAEDAKGPIGRGTHERAVVLSDRFIRKAAERSL